MEMQTKTAALELACLDPEQSGAEGKIALKVATMGVIDRHYDILMPGSVGEQQCLISQFNHASSRGAAVPIGKGRIYEQGNDLLFEGELDMKLGAACDTWHALNFAPELYEVSWGFLVTDATERQVDGEWVRGIEKTIVREVCPVMVGAGIDTGVISVKSDENADQAGSADGNAPLPLLPTAAEVVVKALASRLTGVYDGVRQETEAGSPGAA